MSVPGFNGKQRIIDVPGSGSAYLAVLASGPVRRLRFLESTKKANGTANTPQGLTYQLPNDGSANGFTTVFDLPVNDVKELPDGISPSMRGEKGEIIGNGPGVLIGVGVTAATTLFNVRSQTATGTSIILEEYY